MFLWFALATTSLRLSAQKLLDCFLPLYFYQSILVAACSKQTEFLLRVIFSRALLTVALREGLTSDFHICCMWRACLVCLRWILQRRGRKYGLCVNGEKTRAGRGWRVKEAARQRQKSLFGVIPSPSPRVPIRGRHSEGPFRVRRNHNIAVLLTALQNTHALTHTHTHTGRHGDNLNQSPSNRSERSLIPSCVSSSLKAFSSYPPSPFVPLLIVFPPASFSTVHCSSVPVACAMV